MPKAPKSVKKKSDSHLYTDDNPATTLKGTGFKDATTALRTIELVSKRSLTYQFQTINTMLHRARHHPHATPEMQKAITILADWTATYKTRKSELLTYKLLPKAVVEKYLPSAESHNEDQENEGDSVNTEFAVIYISLPPKARLANTLVNPKQPGEEDWEVCRYRALCALTHHQKRAFLAEELWDSDGVPSEIHLRMIMWSYSPASKKL